MGGRPRSTRKLKQWMMEQVDGEQCPGLVWEDRKLGMFRIPWKHAGKQDYRHDEDAAIFKAWAKFKGKYKEGDKIDPATWKTRMRCALNKSSEFEEVPQRSQLDISEPYKVYRIIEGGAEKKKPLILKPDVMLKSELLSGSDFRSDSTQLGIKLEEQDSGCDPSSGSEMSAQEEGSQENPLLKRNFNSILKVDVNTHLLGDLAPSSPGILDTDPNAMFVLFRYGGVDVGSAVSRHGCKISSAVPRPAGEASFGPQALEKLSFPSPSCVGDPGKRQATQDLLPFLERGLMLDSNSHGIFAQRLCQGRVYWMGPGGSGRQLPNKLERNQVEKLFDRAVFDQELELFQKGQGALPQHQVTLCFGEELSKDESHDTKLITVQVHQVAAQRLIDQEKEIQMASFLFLEPLSDTGFSHDLQQVSNSLFPILL